MIKIIHRYFRGRWERFYLRNHWHLVLDLSLSIIIIILVIIVFVFHFYRPNFPWLGDISQPIVDLNNPPLELSFSAATSTVKALDGATLIINFENIGPSVINNLIIDFNGGDNNFTLNKLEIAENSAQGIIQGRTLVFPRIASGEGGEVKLKVYFSVKDLSQRVLNWQAKSEYAFGGQILKENNTLPPLTLAADLTVKSYAYYTSPQGDQLGIGPLPPVVGIPTSYWIFWETKSAYDFKNLVFSARLPKGVELASGRSLLSGAFNYSSSSRQIIWKISDLKGNNDSYRLGFEVQLSPITSQVGQILPLLSNFRYYAVDALTGEEISNSLAPLDTDLEADRFNSGQGRVIAQ
jgi:hypothetical protein